MSQIEIPGWVLRQAMNAEFCGRSMRDALSFGTDHDYEVLEAALRAALAGWLVQEGWKYQGLFPNVPPFRKDRADGYATPIYTLRKDKTP